MLSIAIRNLLRSRIRSLLTLSGITGSLALFVALSTISNDLKDQLDNAMVQCRVDLVIQQKGSATPVSSRIEDSLVRELQQREDIAAAAPIIIGSVKIPRFPYLFLFGISSADTVQSAVAWLGGGLKEGRLFHKGAREVIVGERVARKARLSVGDKLRMGFGKPFTVTGIYRVGEDVLDGGLLADIDQTQELLKREGFVNMILVEGRNRDQLSLLKERLANDFPTLEIVPSGDLRGRIRALSMIDAFIAAVSVTALVLSGLLLLNTLLMAISERTREIGILMAIGWPRLRIIRLIMLESVVLCMLGGLLGFITAYPALLLLNLLPETGPGWIPLTPSWELLPVTIALACILSLLSSLYPALHATRLVPAAALRFE